MALSVSLSISKNFELENHWSKQDNSIPTLLHIAVGSRNGYRLYTLKSVEEIEETYRNTQEEYLMIERLFDSSLVAAVSSTATRTLKVWHYRKCAEVCVQDYGDTILSIRMSRTRMVVVLVNELHIYNIDDMQHIHCVTTDDNMKGICALTTPKGSDHLVAYPGSSSCGAVALFDVVALYSKRTISAHQSPVSALAFNSKGTMLATASQTGTVIRVFKTQTGEKLFEFRRGLKRCADICDLSFSLCGLYLASSSNTETIHVFRLLEGTSQQSSNNGSGSLQDKNGAAAAAAASYSGYFGSYWSTLQTMLPTSVTNVIAPERAYATAYLPASGVKSAIAIVPIQGNDRLVVATSEGIVHVYTIPKEGGNCLQYRTHHLVDAPVRSSSHNRTSSSSLTAPSTSRDFAGMR